MRKIVYISLPTPSIDTALLDACKAHTSLLEPLNDSELLLDLSSFNRIGEILNLLADTLAGLDYSQACIGLAASPLLARLVVQRRSWDTSAKLSCRSFKKKSVTIRQVIPGQEALFMKTLALEDFPLLSARECRLLKRLGYSWIGDLADLGPDRLRRLLKKDVSTLWQNCCGRDYSPVRGLYPPECLGYSVVLENGCQDYTQFYPILQKSAHELGELLWHRQTRCHHIELELELETEQTLHRERQISSACHDAPRLLAILEALCPTALPGPVVGFRVFLKDLKPIEVQSQDLFTLRYTYQEEAKQQKRSASMEQLLQRFPGRIGLGMAVERREQILLFWDPWRFPQGEV